MRDNPTGLSNKKNQQSPLEKSGAIKTEIPELDNIRDLSDFCLNWPILRKHFLSKNASLDQWDPDKREVLSWLICLADKTCTLNSD